MPMINVEDSYILEETGEQVDKVAGLFTKDEDTTSGEKAFAQLNIGTAGSNRNLLDNPFFQVNQRGWTSGMANNVYTVDRWKTSSSSSYTVAVNADGSLTINALFYQKVSCKFRTGTVLTISYMKSNGDIVTKTGTITATEGFAIGNNAFGFYYRPSTGIGDFQMQLSGETIVAAKLELGSVSTLANDVPPDYGQELDKCLYYFERITNNGSSPITIGAGFADGANALYAPVRMHRKRAGIATVSTSGAIYAGQRSSNISVSSVSQYSSTPDGIITLLANAPSSFTSNEYYRLALGAGAHIDFSADL